MCYMVHVKKVDKSVCVRTGILSAGCGAGLVSPGCSPVGPCYLWTDSGSALLDVGSPPPRLPSAGLGARENINTRAINYTIN